MKKILAAAAAILCLAACGNNASKNTEAEEAPEVTVIEGVVYDASMNNITVVTGTDTVNISKMDVDPSVCPGVTIGDSVKVECVTESTENGDILKVSRLVIAE